MEVKTQLHWVIADEYKLPVPPGAELMLLQPSCFQTHTLFQGPRVPFSSLRMPLT